MTFIPECDEMGLHPYLHDYPKTIEQVEVLIGAYNEVLFYYDNLRDPLVENRMNLKHADSAYKGALQKLEAVAEYLVKYAPDLEAFDLIKSAIEKLPAPDKTIPKPRDFKRYTRTKIETMLKEADFSNITKITNDIFTAAEEPHQE